MIPLETVSEYLYEHVQLLKQHNTSKGIEFYGRCPLCGDSKKSKIKKRFHLTWFNGQTMWNCFNCGENGTFFKLCAILEHIDISEVFKRYTTFNKERIFKRLSKSKENHTIHEKPKITYNNFLINECISDSSETAGLIEKVLLDKLIEFKEKRKITMPLYISTTGRFKNRVIIPVFEGTECVFFQGRAINEFIQPKYLNPQSEKSNIIPNINMLERDKYIIVCEGLLDSYSVQNGTACLGKEISNIWLESVKKLTDIGIILAYDNDLSGMESLGKFLNSEHLSSNIKYFLMPKEYKNIKDLNHLLTEKQNIINTYRFVVDNSFSKLETVTKLKLENWRRGM